jgi:hypothetical protein
MFIVEDGTGVAGANSGVSEAEFEAYCEDRGLTPTAGADALTALVRATAWVEAKFGVRFPGTRLKGRSQGLSFPTKYATDRYGFEIADDVVPVEYKYAICEAALREMASPGSLAPDVATGAAGGAIKRLRQKLGPIEEETEYAVSSGGERSTDPIFPMIEGILAPLINRPGVSGSGMVLLVRA